KKMRRPRKPEMTTVFIWSVSKLLWPTSTSIFWTQASLRCRFLDKRDVAGPGSPGAFFVAAPVTPCADAGCPRSLARLAARWWLRGTKKMPRPRGRAGASRDIPMQSVLDRRSQSTHAGLQRPYTDARLCPEVEPRELCFDSVAVRSALIP